MMSGAIIEGLLGLALGLGLMAPCITGRYPGGRDGALSVRPLPCDTEHRGRLDKRVNTPAY